jgi:hypothetical protein
LATTFKTLSAVDDAQHALMMFAHVESDALRTELTETHCAKRC